MACAGSPMFQCCCKLTSPSTAFSFYKKRKGKGWGRVWKQRELRWQEKKTFLCLSVLCSYCPRKTSVLLGTIQPLKKCTNVGTIHTSVPTWPPMTSLVAIGETLPLHLSTVLCIVFPKIPPLQSKVHRGNEIQNDFGTIIVEISSYWA